MLPPLWGPSQCILRESPRNAPGGGPLPSAGPAGRLGTQLHGLLPLQAPGRQPAAIVQIAPPGTPGATPPRVTPLCVRMSHTSAALKRPLCCCIRSCGCPAGCWGGGGPAGSCCCCCCCCCCYRPTAAAAAAGPGSTAAVVAAAGWEVAAATSSAWMSGLPREQWGSANSGARGLGSAPVHKRIAPRAPADQDLAAAQLSVDLAFARSSRRSGGLQTAEKSERRRSAVWRCDVLDMRNGQHWRQGQWPT